MTIEKKPWTNYTLDEDKPDPLEQGKVFTVRMSAIEYKQHKKDMELLHCTSEGTTLKKLAEIGRNVLHSTFTPKTLRWIADPARRTRREE